MKNKKAQNEIVGFVMIVIIVVIIGVIFLGINLRKSQRQTIGLDDAELGNFLFVTSKFTTDCVINEPFYASIEELLKESYKDKNSKCTDERLVSEILVNTYTSILNNTQLKAEKDRPVKYSKLRFYYYADIEDANTKFKILEDIEQGESAGCANKRGGRQQIYASPGDIVIEFEICE